MNLQALTDKIQQKSQFVDAVFNETSKVIVGQRQLLERLMEAMLSDGHVLLEGLPGLAKTLTIKTLAEVWHLKFQ